MIRTSFSLVQQDVIAHLDQYEVSEDEGAVLTELELTRWRRQAHQAAEEEQLFIVSALLQRVGFWIHAWQQPISVFWSSVLASLALRLL